MAVTKEDVVKLYVAMFNRAPEGSGVEYWLDQATKNAWDVATLADYMMYSVWSAAQTDSTFAEDYPQYANLNFSNLTADTVRPIIETVYQILFNKDYDTDPEGIDYWVNNVINKKRSLGVTIADMLYSAEQIASDPNADPSAMSAAQAYLNKVQVAEYFTEKVSIFNGDFTTYQEIIANVTDDPSTVDNAILNIEALAQTLEASILRNEIVLHYSFDEDNILADVSGNQNNGIPDPGLEYRAEPGQWGNCLLMEVKDQNSIQFYGLKLPNDVFKGSFTFNVWLKINGEGSANIIDVQTMTSEGYKMETFSCDVSNYSTDSRLSIFNLQENYSQEIPIQFSYDAKDFHMYTIARDYANDVITFYIDGERVGQTPDIFPQQFDDVILGWGSAFDNEYLDYSILYDELIVWDEVLTSDEVHYLYEHPYEFIATTVA